MKKKVYREKYGKIEEPKKEMSKICLTFLFLYDIIIS